MIRAKWLFAALTMAGLLWLALSAFCPQAKQMQLFTAAGTNIFQDFQIPRVCAAVPNPYEVQQIPPEDRCYAPIAYALVKPFPEDPYAGGLAFTAFGAACFLLALGLLLRTVGGDFWWAIGGAVASFPFLFSLERANSIWLSAAGIAVFLAWFDAKAPWKRQLALLALAFACALKLTPAVFGVFLLKERRWRDLLILAGEGAFLLLTPFFLLDGLDLIDEWIACMRLHLEAYADSKSMGFARLWTSLAFWLGGGSVKGTLFSAGRLADVALGLMAVTTCFRSGDKARGSLLLSGAMLLIPGVSQVYTYLYLLIPFSLLSSRRLAVFDAGLWFVLLCPLVLPFHAWSLNSWLSNVAFLALVCRAVQVGKCYNVK